MKYLFLIILVTLMLPSNSKKITSKSKILDTLYISPKETYFIDNRDKISELSKTTSSKLFSELNKYKMNFIQDLNYKNEINTFKVTTYTKSYYSHRNNKKTSSYKHIDINEILFTYRPEWNEVIDYYGGISKMSYKRIRGSRISETKHLNKGYFDLSAIIEKIEIINQDKCLATIRYKGDNFQFDYHNITTNPITIEGVYSIETELNLEDKTAFQIYDLNATPNINLTIPGTKYFDTKTYKVPVTDILYTDLDEKFSDYKDGFKYIFKYSISNKEYYNIQSIQPLSIKNKEIRIRNKRIYHLRDLEEKERVRINTLFEDKYFSLTLPFTLTDPWFGKEYEKDSKGNITSVLGVNLLLGLSSKNFFNPIKARSFNNYWHYGSIFIYYPYIGIGTDYVFKRGFYIGLKTYYIVPTICIGKYF